MTSSKIRFSTGAYAIEATPKTLRNWLARQQLSLMTETERKQAEGNSGWIELTLIDIAFMSVTKRLVDFGVKVDDASRMSRSAILDLVMGHIRTERGSAMHVEPEAQDINAALAGVRFAVWPDPAYAFGWRSQVLRGICDSPAPAAILIKVDTIVARALERTREHLDGKAS